MALTSRGIGYEYSAGTDFHQRAVEGVSFTVEPGELALVIGSTGSGKSTLLRMLAGLLAPAAGTMSVDGVALTAASARGVIGLVFQDAESQLFAETVLDDVAFGPRNLGVGPSDIPGVAQDALHAVGLDPAVYARRSPFGLSGGEARRVAIAGVLAMRPRYLLLDEPTAGLDALGRRAVRDAVRVARREAGVVVVSHSAEEFLGQADTVIVLDEGRVAFCGAAADLVGEPALFERAGLRAPEALHLLMSARERGFAVPEFSLDPEVVAETLRRAGVWST